MNYLRLVLAAVAALIIFFAWGFLTEGWLIRKDFAASAALYRTSDLQMKYMPFGLASVLVALLAVVVIYARWCDATSGAASGLQFDARQKRSEALEMLPESLGDLSCLIPGITSWFFVHLQGLRLASRAC